MADLVGLVLAGGAGRRLGRDKGSLELEGRTLALRAAEPLSEICGRVLISIAPGADNPAPGYPAIEDAAPAGRGPLAGIHAAFLAVAQADLLVLACDYPRVECALFRRLLAAAEAGAEMVFPRDEAGRDHPLVGLWRRSVAAAVERALARDVLAVRDLVRERRVQRVGPRQLGRATLARGLLNVNRPNDLERLAGDGNGALA